MATQKFVDLQSPTTSTHATHHSLNLSLEQLTTHFDTVYRALWCTLKTSPTPVLTPTLLKNIRTLQDTVAQYCHYNPRNHPKYIIWQSDSHQVFNLGLDLGHVYDLVTSRNEQGLENYINLCIDAFYINLIRLDITPLITISLIRGKAYGGGLDAALVCDIVVTESNAKCCFPEIRYNLLPSMGTLKMLLRQYPPAVIEPLLFDGRCFDLEKLHNMHLIDSIVKEGDGSTFIRDKIKQLHKRHAIYADLYQARVKNVLMTYDELADFKRNWIKAALDLKPDNIRRLNRLVLAQEKLASHLDRKK